MPFGDVPPLANRLPLRSTPQDPPQDTPVYCRNTEAPSGALFFRQRINRINNVTKLYQPKPMEAS
jgi:hypothetical protein